MQLRLFDCFRSKASLGRDSNQGPLGQHDQTVLLEQERPKLTAPREALDLVQTALLSLGGSWIGRVDGLICAFEDQGIVAELYGIFSSGTSEPEEFILLSPSTNGPPDRVDSERCQLLQRMSSARAPVTLLLSPSSVTRTVLHQSASQRSPIAAAVPLIHGDKLVGALWLEEQMQQQLPTARSRTAPAGRAAMLLRGDELLRQLSFTASMCLLGLGLDTLVWLTAAVARLRAAPSMQVLTAQLCSAVTSHVRCRFVLEAHASAAMVPPGPDKQLALLFRVQPGAVGDTAGESDRNPSGGDGCDASRPSPVSTIPGNSGSSGCRRKESIYPCSVQSRRSTSTTFTTPASTTNTTAVNHNNLTLTGRSLPNDDAGSRTRSMWPLLPGMAGTSAPPTSPTSTGQTARLGSCRALTAPAVVPNLVVALSAKEVATVTAAACTGPPALHASVFPLRNTLLQAVLAQQRRPTTRTRSADPGDGSVRPGAAAILNAPAPAGDVSPASRDEVAPLPGVIVDTQLYVQNVGNPSHDVCFLMGPKKSTAEGMYNLGGGSGGHSFVTGLPIAGTPTATHTVPQSLVLLTLQLGEGAALGLYLCFPKRLPAQLLEAVRSSCQELLDVALVGPVRDKLHGSLAPEYNTLKAAAPGSYAVVRGMTSKCDDPVSPTAVLCCTPTSEGGHRSFFEPFSRSRRAQIGPQQPDELPSTTLSTAELEGVEPQDAPRVLLEEQEPRGLPILRRSFQSMNRLRPSRRRLTDRSQLSMIVPGSAGNTPTPASNSMLNLLLGSPPGDVFALHHTNSTGFGVPDGPTASIITVASAEVGSNAAHQRMDLLVSSIQATIQASTANSGVTSAFASDLDQLELQEVLGRGGGGVVLKGLLSGSLPVAVKMMELPDESAEAPADQMRVRRGMVRNAMELAVQSSLSHPNIVQFYSTFNNVVLRCRREDKSNIAEMDPTLLYLQVLSSTETGSDGSNVTCILAEYCDKGSLQDALHSRTFPRHLPSHSADRHAATDPGHMPFSYDIKGVYMTLLDVALALRHLHSMNLVHRDIKPGNLLLKSSPRDYRGFTVKLADFGFVLHLSKVTVNGTRYASVDHPCGTITHMAPECLKRDAKVDASADIYSFGILMWEMLAGGVRPYPNTQVEKVPRIVHEGARPLFADSAPAMYRNLAHLCWRTDPARRPRAAELVAAISSLLNALP